MAKELPLDDAAEPIHSASPDGIGPVVKLLRESQERLDLRQRRRQIRIPVPEPDGVAQGRRAHRVQHAGPDRFGFAPVMRQIQQMNPPAQVLSHHLGGAVGGAVIDEQQQVGLGARKKPAHVEPCRLVMTRNYETGFFSAVRHIESPGRLRPRGASHRLSAKSFLRIATRHLVAGCCSGNRHALMPSPEPGQPSFERRSCAHLIRNRDVKKWNDCADSTSRPRNSSFRLASAISPQVFQAHVVGREQESERGDGDQEASPGPQFPERLDHKAPIVWLVLQHIHETREVEARVGNVGQVPAQEDSVDLGGCRIPGVHRKDFRARALPQALRAKNRSPAPTSPIRATSCISIRRSRQAALANSQG